MNISEDQALLKIYSASAGSGKTFTLTRSFLKLALADPLQKPFRILAITFTNKATSEMRTRILDALSALASDAPSEHLAYLADTLQINQEAVRDRARTALHEILHGYSRFSVTTIDKFFQKVLRSFAREIKRVGFETELNHDQAAAEMTRGLFDDLDKNSELRNWLLEYARERTGSGKSWDFRSEIQQYTGILFSEDFKNKFGVFGQLPELGAFTQKKEALQALVNETETQVQTLALQIRAGLAAAGVKTDDFPGKSRSPARKTELWAEGNILSLPEDLKKLQELEEKTQKTPELLGVYLSVITPVLQSLDTLVKEKWTLYLTAREVLKQFYLTGITADLLKHLENYRRDNNILLLSDSTDLIHLMTSEQDTPFIYEKIGSRYDHFLLDEFQDTSAMQWENLYPLLKNSTDQGFENLIVGDAKQAIYRWRNGDRDLILYKVQEQFGQPPAQTFFLDTNYRSYSHIVTFNNTLALLASESLIAWLLNREYEQDSLTFLRQRRTHELYRASVQKTNARTGGYASLEWLAQSEDDEDTDPVAERLLQVICEAQDRGYRAGDICILTRRRSDGQRIAAFLLEKQKQYPQYRLGVVSSESGLLMHAPVIRILINAFRLVKNPTALLPCVELLCDWHELRGIPFEPEEWLSREPLGPALRSLLPDDFYPEKLAQKSLPDLFHSLLNMFGLSNAPQQSSYLQSLEDTLLGFLKKYRTGLADFLEFWDENKHSIAMPAAENTDGIRLMTVHKSKGLEFPLLIFPFGDISLKPGRSTLWTRKDSGWLQDLGAIPVNYSQQLAETEFREEYEMETSESLTDALNLFYVAITRAEKELYLLAPEPKRKADGGVSDPSSLDKWLYQYLVLDRQDLSAQPEGTFPLQQLRTDDRFEIGQREAFQPKQKGTDNVFFHDTFRCNPHRSIRIKPARILTEKKQVRLGMLSHEILAVTRSQSDIGTIIKTLQLNGEITAEEEAELHDMLDHVLHHPQMRAWFNTTAEVLTETPLINPAGEIRIPDRILLHDTFSEIIDFKTGSPRSEHELQVKEYAQLIGALHGKPCKAWLVYLSDMNIQAIV